MAQLCAPWTLSGPHDRGCGPDLGMLHRLLYMREALGKEQVCTLLYGRIDEPGRSVGWSIGNNCFGHLIVVAEPDHKVCNALGVIPGLHEDRLREGGVWTGISPPGSEQEHRGAPDCRIPEKTKDRHRLVLVLAVTVASPPTGHSPQHLHRQARRTQPENRGLGADSNQTGPLVYCGESPLSAGELARTVIAPLGAQTRTGCAHQTAPFVALGSCLLNL